MVEQSRVRFLHLFQISIGLLLPSFQTFVPIEYRCYFKCSAKIT